MTRKQYQIVVLDDVWLNKVQQNRLELLGELISYPSPPKNRQEVIERLAIADIVLISEVPLDEGLLRSANQLRLISLWSSGYNHVDVESARSLGIKVCNAPGCSANAIAEHTISCVIYFVHRMSEADSHVRQGSYSWDAFVTPELRSQTFGVIGLGEIGSRVAEIANAIGCRVISTTRRPSLERAAHHNVTFVDLDTLLSESNVISINCALTSETDDLVGIDEFRKMKQQPILVNTARGRIINQNALVQALRGRLIRAAILDVLRDEPPDPSNPLFRMENILFTPHSAGSSIQAFECLSDTCVRNVERFIVGNPQNIVWSNKT